MKPIGETLNSSKPRPLKTGLFKDLPIRPSVRKKRLVIDNEYFEKGYGAVFHHSVTTIYNILAKHANHKTQTCFPSAETMMKLGGIGNRRTLFDGIRILEAFSLIAIVHSKGRGSNRYALLDPSVWKPANSIEIETIKKTRRSKATVALNTLQQSQNQPANSGTIETRNHISKSDKEIKGKIESRNTSLKKSELLERLSRATASVVTPYFREEDIIEALEEIYAGGEIKPPGFKTLLAVLRRRGAIQTKELPFSLL